ncbi:MAG: NAD-dependent epimerase/dehydratase family protein [Promethearchaeota archaeon]
MSIFITGATGQTGSQLAEYLIETNKLGVSSPTDIICLVRDLKKADFLKKIGVTIEMGDLLDLKKLQNIMKKYDINYIFHFAANLNHYNSFQDLYEPNCTGTTNMLDAFVSSHAKWFFYASSISVYKGYLNKGKYQVFDESMPLGGIDPQKDNNYAVTKRIAENSVKEYSKKYPKKNFIITRLGPISGPRDRMIIPSFVKILPYPVPKLIDKGKDTFSLTPTRDIARAVVFLTKFDNNSGNAFNIVGAPVTYKEIFEYFCSYYNRKPPKISIPNWLFKGFIPFLTAIRLIAKRNIMIQTIFSETALNYIGKSITYKTEKIQDLGFEFKTSIKEAIITGLMELDPNKKLVKANIKMKKMDGKEKSSKISDFFPIFKKKISQKS